MKRKRGWTSGSSREHRRQREIFLAEHPICALCDQPSVFLDHITPLAEGGSMSDPGNWQALCRRCHAEKTARENTTRRGQRYRPRALIDPATGLPLDGEDHWWAE